VRARLVAPREQACRIRGVFVELCEGRGSGPGPVLPVSRAADHACSGGEQTRGARTFRGRTGGSFRDATLLERDPGAPPQESADQRLAAVDWDGVTTVGPAVEGSAPAP
jgi:hypothetical protein